MRVLRLICAFALAAGLAMLPVSAAFANMPVANAKAHVTMAPDQDCPCCNPEKAQACVLKCCMQALLVQAVAATKPAPPRFDESAARPFAAPALGPDPPPPRS